MQLLQKVITEFDFTGEQAEIETFGNGLINHTWKVTAADNVYILQRVNHFVFKQPESIAYNIELIAAFLKEHHPSYHFVAPLVATDGSSIVYKKEEGYFRMFPFVRGAVSKDVVKTAGQAFEAAAQFGRFTKLLCKLDICQLKITIPSFHDLTLRYHQFLTALKNGNQQRIKEADILVKELIGYGDIAKEFSRINNDDSFKLRVTHHDTKISNVLFDTKGKGICVIDLDTVMPGYFISDVGDMMRSYLSPVNEDEKDFDKIEVRADFYKAIVRGYFNEMKDELSEAEKKLFFFSGKFMIYMQAIRFLTDYLNDDIYYGVNYPGHNLTRAGNQTVLLNKLIEKEKDLASITDDIF